MSSKVKFVAKCVFSAIYALAIYGGLLFLPAWTLRWPRGWWFMGLVLVADVVSIFAIFRGHEDVLDERLKPPIQKGQPPADKILTTTLLLAFAAATIFIPLDIFRSHLLRAPSLPLAAVGFLLCVVGCYISILALRENAFAAPACHRYRGLPPGAASHVFRRIPVHLWHAAVARLLRGDLGGLGDGAAAGDSHSHRRAFPAPRIAGL